MAQKVDLACGVLMHVWSRCAAEILLHHADGRHKAVHVTG